MATTNRFAWYELRTIDAQGAQSFYADALGFEVRDVDGTSMFFHDAKPAAGLSQLSERAIASGAPPHWLGHIPVDDVAAAVDRFVASDGQRVGPLLRRADGVELAVIRDAPGVIVGICTPRKITSDAVSWNHLHTGDAERSWATYAELFGWKATGRVEVGPSVGSCQLFSWHGEGPSVGGIANTARLPGVHPHWLFFFEVPDAEGCAAKVRACGGTALDLKLDPTGRRIFACEDPKGAAFGLRARR